MALLFTCSICTLYSHSNSTSTLSRRYCDFFSLQTKTIDLQPRPFLKSQAGARFLINRRNAVIVRASSDVDGTDSSSPESPKPASDNKPENVSIENLPLESELKEKADQKAKMKLAKKIRLRRKRLVRKRHLRKKGRWPPSKLKKNKNV